MSKQKKQSQPTFSATRNFKLTHQSLTINDINFKTKTITVNFQLSTPIQQQKLVPIKRHNLPAQGLIGLYTMVTG